MIFSSLEAYYCCYRRRAISSERGTFCNLLLRRGKLLQHEICHMLKKKGHFVIFLVLDAYYFCRRCARSKKRSFWKINLLLFHRNNMNMLFQLYYNRSNFCLHEFQQKIIFHARISMRLSS